MFSLFVKLLLLCTIIQYSMTPQLQFDIFIIRLKGLVPLPKVIELWVSKTLLNSRENFSFHLGQFGVGDRFFYSHINYN